MNQNILFFSGLGKRKTSVAKVFLKEGTGLVTVNEKTFEQFFMGITEEGKLILRSLKLVNLTDKYDIHIIVKGGGISGQLEAMQLAISKAICQINTDYRIILNQSLFLRRDSRIKERRKYGLKKARKASQYSKR